MERPRARKLVLGSTSSYRARLLARLRIPFDTVAPPVDESPLANETPPALAERLAIAKAQSVNRRNQWVIGSDQVAVAGEQALGKPGSAARARTQLRAMSGKRVTFYTGLALWHAASETLLSHTEPYAVQLRPLTDRDIDRYVALDDPVDCAGSFKWESLGIALFEAMDGKDPTALEGLPLIALCRLLRSAGFELPPAPELAAHPG